MARFSPLVDPTVSSTPQPNGFTTGLEVASKNDALGSPYGGAIHTAELDTLASLSDTMGLGVGSNFHAMATASKIPIAVELIENRCRRKPDLEVTHIGIESGNTGKLYGTDQSGKPYRVKLGERAPDDQRTEMHRQLDAIPLGQLDVLVIGGITSNSSPIASVGSLYGNIKDTVGEQAFLERTNGVWGYIPHGDNADQKSKNAEAFYGDPRKINDEAQMLGYRLAAELYHSPGKAVCIYGHSMGAQMGEMIVQAATQYLIDWKMPGQTIDTSLANVRVVGASTVPTWTPSRKSHMQGVNAVYYCAAEDHEPAIPRSPEMLWAQATSVYQRNQDSQMAHTPIHADDYHVAPGRLHDVFVLGDAPSVIVRHNSMAKLKDGTFDPKQDTEILIGSEHAHDNRANTACLAAYHSPVRAYIAACIIGSKQEMEQTRQGALAHSHCLGRVKEVESITPALEVLTPSWYTQHTTVAIAEDVNNAAVKSIKKQHVNNDAVFTAIDSSNRPDGSVAQGSATTSRGSQRNINNEYEIN